MSDAAILRRAASVLRERAGNATPGPWERSTHYGYKIVSQTLTVGHVRSCLQGRILRAERRAE